MSEARNAWEMVALMVVLLLYQSWDVPPSLAGILARFFQIGNMVAMAAIFGYAAVKLQARAKELRGRGGDRPGTWLLSLLGRRDPPSPEDLEHLKEAEQLEPDSGVDDTWYHSMVAAINGLDNTLTAAAVLALAALIAHAFPGSALGALDAGLTGAWHYLLDHYTEKQLFVNGIMGIFWVFWGMQGLFYMTLDFLCAPGRPCAALWQFKMQPHFVPTLFSYLRAWALGLVNSVVLYGVVELLWLWFPYICPNGFSRELPGVASFLFQLACCLPHSQAAFYIVHYLLHESKFLMDHVHYIHHSRTATVAIECIYAHPVEFVAGNIPGLALGPIMVGAHMSVWYVWCTAALTATMWNHSGWQWPILPGNQGHDYHHSHCAPGPEGYQNIGSGVLDALLYTDDYYQAHSWQARVSRRYAGPQFPVERILARHGEGGPRGAAEAP